jgi:hypothetical protein
MKINEEVHNKMQKAERGKNKKAEMSLSYEL